MTVQSADVVTLLWVHRGAAICVHRCCWPLAINRMIEKPTSTSHVLHAAAAKQFNLAATMCNMRLNVQPKRLHPTPHHKSQAKPTSKLSRKQAFCSFNVSLLFHPRQSKSSYKDHHHHQHQRHLTHKGQLSVTWWLLNSLSLLR